MKRAIYVEQTAAGPDGYTFWAFVCLCLDNEGLGVIERAFATLGIEIKVKEWPE